MKVKISVIVPVHDSEEFLCECLDSLVNQTLEEIEIILVNDCSSDNSINILKEYKNRYSSKIVLIDLEENLGPGGARNRGIDAASGKYIGFVDSDDHVEDDMFEGMYEIAESGDYDMVDCGYRNNHILKDSLDIPPDVWGELTIEKRKRLVIDPGYIWSKIIKKSVFTDNNLRFREKVKYEDIDFTRVLCLYINKVCGTDMRYYTYEQNEKSITNSKDTKVQLESRMISIKALVDKFKLLDEYERYKEELTFVIYATYADMLRHITLGSEPEDLTYDIFKKLRDFFIELVPYDYNDNKYIQQMDKKKLRMYAELNNADHKIILNTLCENS